MNTTMFSPAKKAGETVEKARKVKEKMVLNDLFLDMRNKQDITVSEKWRQLSTSK
jgi:hypothetical protein